MFCCQFIFISTPTFKADNNRVVALNVKNGFNMRVNERSGAISILPPKKGGAGGGGGHLKHHFCLTVARFDNDIQRHIRRSSGRIRQKNSFCLNTGESILSILNTKLLLYKYFVTNTNYKILK